MGVVFNGSVYTSQRSFIHFACVIACTPALRRGIKSFKQRFKNLFFTSQKIHCFHHKDLPLNAIS
jgi:hypothetical protein